MHNRPLALATAGALSLSIACAAFAQTTAPPMAENAADSMFMTRAAADGIAEVEMGQLALDKSSDDQVKQLAKRIVDDHSKANEALRVLAQAKQVTLPSTPSTEAQKMADGMKKMEGTKFDQAWADAMVKGHQQAIALFTTESGKTQDAELRKLSSATLPTLKSHLNASRKLEDHLSVLNARDKAMGANKAMDDSSFAHINPAAASTSATMKIPASSTAKH